MVIDRILDGVDLSAVHTILALAGALLSVYVMQLTYYEAEDSEDHWIIRLGRRFALSVLALAFLWSLTYSETRQWQPWPPEIVAMAAIDLLMSVRVAAIWARIYRTGRYRNAQSMKDASRLARN